MSNALVQKANQAFSFSCGLHPTGDRGEARGNQRALSSVLQRLQEPPWDSLLRVLEDARQFDAPSEKKPSDVHPERGQQRALSRAKFRREEDVDNQASRAIDARGGVKVR